MILNHLVFQVNENINEKIVLKSISGHESLKSSSSSYKTFHVVRNSDFYRPKFFVDSIGHENESIDQIKALYMRGMCLNLNYPITFILAIQLGNLINVLLIFLKKFFLYKNNYILSSIFH